MQRDVNWKGCGEFLLVGITEEYFRRKLWDPHAQKCWIERAWQILIGWASPMKFSSKNMGPLVVAFIYRCTLYSR